MCAECISTFSPVDFFFNGIKILWIPLFFRQKLFSQTYSSKILNHLYLSANSPKQEIHGSHSSTQSPLRAYCNMAQWVIAGPR